MNEQSNSATDRSSREKLPIVLQDLATTDPQQAIDYLYGRKNHYKRCVFKVESERDSLNEKIRDLTLALKAETRKKRSAQRRAGYWKNKNQKELTMKRYWMYGCGVATFGLATLMLVMFTVNQMASVMSPHSVPEQQEFDPSGAKTPTSGKTQQTPAHILASVNIYNGSVQGSGTIISKGEKYALMLSAAHNFVGKIGNSFWVYYPDGTYTEATLLAVDRTRDLALARVDVDTILANSYISKTPKKGILDGVGYTGGQGPNKREMNYTGSYFNASNRHMWNLSVINGPFWDGDSGGGVFIDGGLVGVTSQRDAYVWKSPTLRCKRMYACAYSEIVSFLNENPQNVAECGDWSTPPEVYTAATNAPPLWKPNPNVPIYVEGGTDSVIRNLKADVDSLKDQLEATTALGFIQDTRTEPVKVELDDLLKTPSEVDKPENPVVEENTTKSEVDVITTEKPAVAPSDGEVEIKTGEVFDDLLKLPSDIGS